MGSSVQQGLGAQYTILVKFFPSLPSFGDEVWALFCATPSNKLGTLLAVRLACWAALPFNIACKPILLSDPARAVLHSARSAGEISEVLCSPILLSDPARAVLHSARSAGEISEVLCPCHCRKSHRLT